MHPKGASKNRDDHAIFKKMDQIKLALNSQTTQVLFQKDINLKIGIKVVIPILKLIHQIEERLALSQEPILLKFLSKQ